MKITQPKNQGLRDTPLDSYLFTKIFLCKFIISLYVCGYSYLF
jgi:hypothetical protein